MKMLKSLFFMCCLSQPVLAEVADEVKTAQTMIQECAAQGRDICVVFGATQIMTDIPSLSYMYDSDADALLELVSAFEKASFKVSAAGRPDFRKFLAENAIWTMDFYNERFLAENDPSYSYEKIRHFYAGYQLLRADACRELKNDPCAESALWNVANARKKGRWPGVAERFNMEPSQSQDLVNDLFVAYNGKF